jgi:hypothetical protein
MELRGLVNCTGVLLSICVHENEHDRMIKSYWIDMTYPFSMGVSMLSRRRPIPIRVSARYRHLS